MAHKLQDSENSNTPAVSPVPLSTDKNEYVNDDPENASDFIDLFPALSNFRRRFTSNFVFMYNNINSYRHKHASIGDILTKHLVDFMATAETKLDGSFPSNQYCVENFELYRQDLTSKSGGLVVHVRNDLPQRRLTHAEVNSNGFESIYI